MQQKQLIWLAGSFIGLLALAFISGTFGSEFSTIDVPALSISSDQIEHFDIVTSDSTIYNIAKEDGVWRIKSPVDALADSLAVSRFIENLGMLRLESVVSSNPQKYNEYGVGESGKHLNITWGRNKKTFYVGNNGPDFQSIYVRLSNDSRVFLTKGRLNLPESLDLWRDKTVIDIPEPEINRIAVTSPATAFEVVKKGTTWSLTEDGDESPADSTRIAQWLKRFSPLKAVAFVDDKPAPEVKADATHQIHFSVNDGSTKTIWILDEASRLLVVTSGKDATFNLTQSLLSSFVPDPSDLIEE